MLFFKCNINWDFMARTPIFLKCFKYFFSKRSFWFQLDDQGEIILKISLIVMACKCTNVEMLFLIEFYSTSWNVVLPLLVLLLLSYILQVSFCISCNQFLACRTKAVASTRLFYPLHHLHIAKMSKTKINCPFLRTAWDIRSYLLFI